MATQPGKKPHVVEKMFKCYKYSGNIDDDFPVVNLHFANSLSLKVLPHQYFFQVEDDEWCIDFQNSNLKEKTGKELTLLGVSIYILLLTTKTGQFGSRKTGWVELNHIVLSDKLVTYDMEKKVIGGSDYDCKYNVSADQFNPFN
ncbi:putative aspartic peptidase A1 family, aspartic peptidase domain superfamily, xylanase inhibitor [Helianthus anomalus]